MAKHRVRLFAAHREAAGQPEVVVALADGATVGQLRAALVREVPALRGLAAATLIAVNGEFASDERRLKSGDVLAVFPPVAGG